MPSNRKSSKAQGLSLSLRDENVGFIRVRLRFASEDWSIALGLGFKGLGFKVLCLWV